MPATRVPFKNALYSLLAALCAMPCVLADLISPGETIAILGGFLLFLGLVILVIAVVCFSIIKFIKRRMESKGNSKKDTPKERVAQKKISEPKNNAKRPIEKTDNFAKHILIVTVSLILILSALFAYSLLTDSTDSKKEPEPLPEPLNTIPEENIITNKPSAYFEIRPYTAEINGNPVSYCSTNTGEVYQTTGSSHIEDFENASTYATWFLWNMCATDKYFDVSRADEIILRVYTDTCESCTCKYPVFKVYEYSDYEWVLGQQYDFSQETDYSGNVIYKRTVPGSEKIRIHADGCFYLKVFGFGK